jgi:uncharacterized small protein (DUF1192 family)
MFIGEEDAMRDEDDKPKRKIAHEIGQDLSLLSAFELKERIEVLKEEIQRLDAAMQSKDKAKSLADQFFKS